MKSGKDKMSGVDGKYLQIHSQAREVICIPRSPSLSCKEVSICCLTRWRLLALNTLVDESHGGELSSILFRKYFSQV